MKIAYRKSDLSCVESDNFLGKTFLGFENFVKLASLNEWHHEVKTCVWLEKVVHAYKEGVVATKKNVFFKLSILDLVVLYQDVLPDGFDSVCFVKLRKLSEVHLAEGAATKQHCELEVF